MQVVVLTNGSSHGAEILQALSTRNIPVAAVIVERANKSKLGQVQKSVRKYGYIQTAFDIVSFLRDSMKKKGKSPIPYQNYSDRVVSVNDFMGPECLKVLTELSPDILVLAGAPILKATVLSTAKIAVLNAHPGLLPKYRGVDVILWAVLNGDPVGVTVHRVDSGIDTGAIVVQERISTEPGDNLESLQRKAEVLAGRLMTQVVSEAFSNGRIQAAPQSKLPDTLYRRMPRNLRRKAEKKIGLE
jgi:methionyl-tRNA formyltransferase